jgi:hypothetical protein
MLFLQKGKLPTAKQVLPVFFALCLTAVFALGLAGCSTDPDDDDSIVPATLKGSWVSVWGEEYIITGTEFISKMAGAVGYSGSVKNIRSDDDTNTAGYITIKYTVNNNDSTAVGNYYVVRWENLDTSNKTITLSGASNDAVGGVGYPLITDAETEYSGSIGTKPFQFGSDLLYFTGNSKPVAFMGSWSNDSYENYVITDKTITYSYGLFFGEIVNVRNLGNGKGYITFKYIENSTDTGLIDKYCVLYWENYDDTTVDMVAAWTDSPGDEGKDTQQAAETTYIVGEDPDEYFYGLEDTFTKDLW